MNTNKIYINSYQCSFCGTCWIMRTGGEHVDRCPLCTTISCPYNTEILTVKVDINKFVMTPSGDRIISAFNKLLMKKKDRILDGIN